MADIVAETEMRISMNACAAYGGIVLEAYPTGRKDDRGMIDLRASSHDADADISLTPCQARALGEKLISLAETAARFSTRGFVGSDE